MIRRMTRVPTRLSRKIGDDRRIRRISNSFFSFILSQFLRLNLHHVKRRSCIAMDMDLFLFFSSIKMISLS